MKKERPILFSGPMIKAILAGNKTQTRRLVTVTTQSIKGLTSPLIDPAQLTCPYGKAGDKLWVRETFGYDTPVGASHRSHFVIFYRADGEEIGRRWKSSIFMTRKESRITLEVTGVKVERLQEISEEDAIAEGIEDLSYGKAADIWFRTEIDPAGYRKNPLAGATRDAATAYSWLWDSINGKKAPWSSNPFVYAITFKRV